MSAKLSYTAITVFLSEWVERTILKNLISKKAVKRVDGAQYVHFFREEIFHRFVKHGMIIIRMDLHLMPLFAYAFILMPIPLSKYLAILYQKVPHIFCNLVVLITREETDM